MGNQGVGKNKLMDRLLHLLGAEREYIQLHRDSTIQSLTLLPTLEGGHISFQESPLVIAARTGRILLVDEADKAPLEVVAILKSLAEDGELSLPDGRRLLRRDRWIHEWKGVGAGSVDLCAAAEAAAQNNVILIHEDFRLIVLANRPGMPFLGNNFFRECGDVFHSFIVDNLSRASELSLLKAYGPDVSIVKCMYMGVRVFFQCTSICVKAGYASTLTLSNISLTSVKLYTLLPPLGNTWNLIGTRRCATAAYHSLLEPSSRA